MIDIPILDDYKKKYLEPEREIPVSDWVCSEFYVDNPVPLRFIGMPTNDSFIAFLDQCENVYYLHHEQDHGFLLNACYAITFSETDEIEVIDNEIYYKSTKYNVVKYLGIKK